MAIINPNGRPIGLVGTMSIPTSSGYNNEIVKNIWRSDDLRSVYPTMGFRLLRNQNVTLYRARPNALGSSPSVYVFPQNAFDDATNMSTINVEYNAGVMIGTRRAFWPDATAGKIVIAAYSFGMTYSANTSLQFRPGLFIYNASGTLYSLNLYNSQTPSAQAANGTIRHSAFSSSNWNGSDLWPVIATVSKPTNGDYFVPGIQIDGSQPNSLTVQFTEGWMNIYRQEN
jgi:hypothetical protein